MARYRNANCKLCRREGEKLFLKGSRCLSDKCAIERRQFPPGQHGNDRRRKNSPYGIQLREKQKIRRIYGILEKQFRNYFKKADRKTGVTGEILLQLYRHRRARYLESGKSTTGDVVQCPAGSLCLGDTEDVQSGYVRADLGVRGRVKHEAVGGVAVR